MTPPRQFSRYAADASSTCSLPDRDQPEPRVVELRGHDVPAAEWDAFAQACGASFRCGAAAHFLWQMDYHLCFRLRRFEFRCPASGRKIGQCAVGVGPHVAVFADGLQILPEHQDAWQAVMTALLRELGPGRYRYGSKWNTERPRESQLGAIPGVEVEKADPNIVQAIDFRRFRNWSEYEHAVSANVRRNAKRACERFPALQIRNRNGLSTLLDGPAVVRFHLAMARRKGLDISPVRIALRLLMRTVTMRRQAVTALAFNGGDVLAAFSGIQFGRNVYYFSGGRGKSDSGGASWYLLLSMIRMAYERSAGAGMFFMGPVEENRAGWAGLLRSREQCRVSEFPSSIVNFSYGASPQFGRRTLAVLAAAAAVPAPLHAEVLEGGDPPRFLGSRGALRGIGVTLPTYWAVAAQAQPQHYRRPLRGGMRVAREAGFPQAQRNAARQVGFNGVRTFLDAGPLIDAGTPGALNSLDELLLDMTETVQFFVESGFGLILNLSAEVSPPNPAFSRERVLDGPDGVGFSAYCAALEAVCSDVARRFGPDQVAIELFNEPLHDSGRDPFRRWPSLAPAMWARARRAAPEHTLVVQSGDGAWFGALPELDPSRFDRNTIFSFHAYDPGGFTHQGIGENIGLARIPFPISLYPGGLERALADMRSRVERLAGLSFDRRREIERHNAAELRNMFDPSSPMGPERIDRAWAVVDAWIARTGISPMQVMVGEFGVVSDYNFNGAIGCDAASRARYYKAVREAAEKRGFAGWVAWQSVGDFNIFEQVSVTEHGYRILPELATALGQH